MKSIDLKGRWRYREDPEDRGLREKWYKEKLPGEGFELPGSACGNKIGKKRVYDPKMDEVYRAPRERYEYIAPLWLEREIEIPPEAAGKRARLFLERVNIASEVWLDGEKTGRKIIDLSAPHVHVFKDGLSPGTHRLCLRIDNRNLLHFNDMASGYSIDTQGIWNGIIGRIELQFEEQTAVERIDVYPDEKGIDLRLILLSDVYEPNYASAPPKAATLRFELRDPEGKIVLREEAGTALYCSRQVEYRRLDLKPEDIVFWDEFTPALYTLQVSLDCTGIRTSRSRRFGMRTIRRDGRHFLLNGRRIALRGTTECAQYPLTGYPPMDKASYLERFSKVKASGLNHIRFHAWCPPESAFAAADELGLYLLAEMPMWLNRDIGTHEVGDDPYHRLYYTQAARRISEYYGNHPSFLFFSNGNENMGDFELLDDLITQTKAYDPRRFYTLTSNFDHPVLPSEDYFSAFDAKGQRIRVQGHLYDESCKHSCNHYNEAVASMPLPLISFETGQYAVYPDLDIIEDYSGNMLPVNFMAIRDSMQKAGIYEKRRAYTEASGKFAELLYKEDIESALRTEDFGGFQLLALSDYTGQGTATVGMLDVFFREKAFFKPEKFRTFAGPVVPLFQAKRLFADEDVIDAELSLYDFGKTPVREPLFHLRLSDENGRLLFEEKTHEPSILIPLENIPRPNRLTVSLAVEDYENRYEIFLCEKNAAKPDLPILESAEDVRALAAEGGIGLLPAGLFKEQLPGNFFPVFWSPAHFPSEAACGALIEAAHPVFSGFPTGIFLNYQWKEPLEKASCLPLKNLPEAVKPLIEMVPNFMTNNPASPLFEFRCGKGRFLCSGFDCEAEDPANLQLQRSITAYLASEAFRPKAEWPEEDLTAKLI